MPDVSVLIISWNTRELLAGCLESVVQAAASVLEVEVIVVDNASTDGSPEMVRQRFPKARLIVNPENVGFARANNQSMTVACGRYLLLLNSDAALRLGALTALVKFLDEHREVGMAGGKLLNPDGTFQASFMDFPTLWGELLLMTKLHRLFRSRYFPSYSPQESQQAREVDWIQGACILARREMIDQVGGLDETYFMYSEEVDWCWRARRAGWQICYVPQAEIVHWGGQSIKRVSAQKRARVYYGKWLFFRKNRGVFYAALFRALLLATALPKLGAWSLLLLAPQPDAREAARQNVRAYWLLAVQMWTNQQLIASSQ